MGIKRRIFTTSQSFESSELDPRHETAADLSPAALAAARLPRFLAKSLFVQSPGCARKWSVCVRTSTVVDDQLRMHGLEGLRVVDASVMPTVTSTNRPTPCADNDDRRA
jgi:hypothetical protein